MSLFPLPDRLLHLLTITCKSGGNSSIGNLRAVPGAALEMSVERKLLLLQSVIKVGLQPPKLEDVSVVHSLIYQYFRETWTFGYPPQRIAFHCGPSQRRILSPFCLYVQAFQRKTFILKPLSSEKNELFPFYRSGKRPCWTITHEPAAGAVDFESVCRSPKFRALELFPPIYVRSRCLLQFHTYMASC